MQYTSKITVSKDFDCACGLLAKKRNMNETWIYDEFITIANKCCRDP